MTLRPHFFDDEVRLLSSLRLQQCSQLHSYLPAVTSIDCASRLAVGL
jgi:hypothetical protein